MSLGFLLPPAPGARYSPLHFLAALGAGGITVTFFLWLFMWVPHPARSVPVFEDIAAALAAGPLAQKAMIVAAWAGVAFFAFTHFRLLAWNLRAWAEFRRSPACAELRSSNYETRLLAMPLTLAMSINVGFILGLVFVPGLSLVMEYLFAPAMLGFVALGVWALRLMGDFLGRVLVQGGFDCTRNNSLAQMLPSFAFAMISVGLSAPAALSSSPAIVGLSYMGSSFFGVVAVISGAVALMLGFRAMMEHGASEEGAPNLWVAVPIVTVLAIALMRRSHGLHAHFGAHGTPADSFVALTWLVGVQVMFGLLGYVVLRRMGYFGHYVWGEARSAGSWTLICPVVAGAVMLQFWINKGLVGAGLVDKYSIAYWAVTALALLLQAISVRMFFALAARQLGAPEPGERAASRGATLVEAGAR